MGVLENSLITLENGDKIHVEEIKINYDKLLSCSIDGLHSKSIDKEAIEWSKINPIIEKKGSIVSHKWKETIDKYILVNGKLKLTFDSIVLFKDFEGETTWGYSKSLRKGYYLFTDKFEYEEIKSIKRVKGNVVSFCLSADPYSCYFINGYLVHNTSICGVCYTCDLWPSILNPYGPHTHSSSASPVTTSFGLGYTQASHYGYAVNLYSDNYISSTWQTNSSSPRLTPWNSFPQRIVLRNNISSSGGYYHVVKYWNRQGEVPETGNSHRDVGWKAYWSSDAATGLQKAKDICTGQYGCPHDIFYLNTHYPSTPSTTNRSFKLIRHSTSTFGMWISLDSGSTWTWYAAGGSNGSGPSNITYSSQGPRGNSKIFIILRFLAPFSSYTRYLWRWGNGSSVIDPVGWHTFDAFS